MTLSDLEAVLAPEKIAGAEDGGKEISGIYTGDFLSRAMSRVRCGDLWITIMNNRNMIAVAALADAAAVILAEGVRLLPDALDAAEKNGITVYSTEKTAYEVCALLAQRAL